MSQTRTLVNISMSHSKTKRTISDNCFSSWKAINSIKYLFEGNTVENR